MVLPMWAFWVTLAVMVVGLLGVILPLVPGAGLILAAAVVYAIAEKFATIDGWTLSVLTVLGVLGVFSDIWVSQMGGKLGGASWKALLTGAALGALGFVIGLFVGGIGAIPLGIAGVLAGVLLWEYREKQDWKDAARASAGWAAGCLLSGVVQLIISMAMIIIFVWQVFRG